MAVDSLRKRKSCIGFGLPFRLTLPVPDGALDQGDRQHAVGLYYGILAVTPSPVPTTWIIEAQGSYISGPVAGGSFVSGPVASGAFVAGPVKGTIKP